MGKGFRGSGVWGLGFDILQERPGALARGAADDVGQHGFARSAQLGALVHKDGRLSKGYDALPCCRLVCVICPVQFSDFRIRCEA